MAHNRDYKPEDILFPNQVITQSELVHEMQSSYIDYENFSVVNGEHTVTLTFVYENGAWRLDTPTY